MKRTAPMLISAELALASITLSTVLGMSRLFVGSDWLAPLALHAVSAHVIVSVARRRTLSLPTTAAIMIAAAELLAAWTSYGATTAYGIPTGRTLLAMRGDLGQAWSLYQSVIAPAPATTGFVVATALAVWFVAFVADWAAFRLSVPFEATLPAGTLFLFTALLGADRGRGWSVGLFAAACLLFLLLHRMARQDDTSHWVADRGPQGHHWLIAAGLTLGALAVAIGTVVGPALPGADAAGVVNPRGLRQSEGSRITISPLVDIRSRLVEQSNVVAFDVHSPQPAYWRLTSLDQFDGRIWSSSGTYGKTHGDLPEAVSTDLPVSTFEQTFDIGALAAIWLPSAYEPRAVDAPGFDVLYDKTSATLIVDRGIENSDGLTYRVTSASPRITSADLAKVTGEVPPRIRDRFLELPTDFSPSVAKLARDLTATAASPYDRALALQRHLRTFTYDLKVGAGHSDAVLEQFLFETRRGYCEQFAGAFAAMARSIGLPARVAVGFTQGTQDPADPAHFVVRGEHAHAWPEVFFAGAGWVSFEPTPGRGQPFGEAYTGVPVAQAATSNPGAATTAPPTTIPDPTATIPDASSGPRPGGNEVDTSGGQQSGGTPGRGLLSRLVGQPLRKVAPMIGAVVVAYLVLFPLALVLRRARRRRRATTPADRVAVAWAEAAEEAALVGYEEVPADTLGQRSARLAAVIPGGDVAEHAARLTHTLEVALFSEMGVDDLDAVRAAESSAVVIAGARAAAKVGARLLRWIDLRPWVRAGRAALRRESQITTTVRADLEAEHELVGNGDRR